MGATKFGPSVLPMNGGEPGGKANASGGLGTPLEKPPIPVFVTIGGIGPTGGGNPDGETPGAGARIVLPGFGLKVPAGLLNVRPTIDGGLPIIPPGSTGLLPVPGWTVIVPAPAGPAIVPALAGPGAVPVVGTAEPVVGTAGPVVATCAASGSATAAAAMAYKSFMIKSRPRQGTVNLGEILNFNSFRPANFDLKFSKA
jgi:hypothetical protein